MQIIISAKTFQLTPGLKEYVEKKTKKIEHIAPRAMIARVELDHDINQRTGLVYRAEISVELPGKILKAGQKADNMRSAIDQCLHKLIWQVEKFKEKKLTASRR